MSFSKRYLTINAIAENKSKEYAKAEKATLEHYGEDVFNAKAIREYLPKKSAEKLLNTINNRAQLDPEIAADVAHGMKQWAIERGATHFTHWFQPLTGSTAEKHDSFLEIEGDNAIFAFSAKNLIVGEPDASSFPSGGLRRTFEARGYTAWDPTSPAFIKRHANGATLCIPTAFCSYTGEALDKKTPLLRSIQCLSSSAQRLMKCFGLKEEKVTVTLGAEQEYFLIDKKFYLHRPDLLQTGRTLFGATPPKHQQLEDHYFGSIQQRVLNFMNEVEDELWRLGVPAKTRHNEVAPGQFELAPMFEDLNLAVDHNMLIMDTLRLVADRHGFVCLLHEKPFAGVNGSGKHNNWSINYGNTNLLNPGNNPQQNAVFLTVLCGIIRAVDTHADMLRASVAHAGNDHRLGANEAPPAIISIYLGDQLNEVIENIEKGENSSKHKAGVMQIGVDTLPNLPKDATDRNRTSPFAFTGNKFEFRAPGSSQSCSGPMTVLNTIVADSFDYIAEKLEGFVGNEEVFNSELQKVLKDIIKTHKRVIFNGDGYTEEWKAEAARRGLPNAATTMDALRCLVNEKNINLFDKYGVYSKKELESRFEVFLEEYHRKIRIEGEIALNIVRNNILPAVIEEFKTELSAVKSATDAGITVGVDALKRNVELLGKGLEDLTEKTEKMEKAVTGLHEEILEAMAELRAVVDRLEKVVSDTLWPLPKYREMLFIK
ncbi:MAG: glutamine synthetase III [Mucispirillum sp.]|nr:glutamine synthetase III [Mucispirillum sp.]